VPQYGELILGAVRMRHRPVRSRVRLPGKYLPVLAPGK